VIVVYFKILFQHSPGMSEKFMKELGDDGWCSIRVSNRVSPPPYKYQSRYHHSNLLGQQLIESRKMTEYANNIP